MDDLEGLPAELQEAVSQYRQYGYDVLKYDRALARENSEDDYALLQDAIAKRNFWQGRIKELIKGRERELNRLLIG